MIKEAINKLREKINLTQKEAESVFEEIMTGFCSDDDIAAFLLALKNKGEAVEEITGAAVIMRRHVVPIKCGRTPILDTCGTGGDGAHTFNISTVSAFVACGAGVTVAKHGNRSVSSKCGSADLLEALGVNMDVDIKVVEECLNTAGIGFLFAPKFHPAMKYAMPARKRLKTRTIFNMLGPLTNPAHAKRQLLGAYDGNIARSIAGVLNKLGTEHAMVVHGNDGLDEITTTGQTAVCEIRNGKVLYYEIGPENFGIKRSNPDDLKGDDAAANGAIAVDILSGKTGPKRDIILLNAGCAIYVGGLAKDISGGIDAAKKAIDSGMAMQKLNMLKDITNRK